MRLRKVKILIVFIFCSSIIFGQKNDTNESMQKKSTLDKLAENKSHLIFLSPHADDAIWSCGGLISKSSRKGCKTEIITIYLGNPTENDLPKLQQKEIDKKGNIEKRKLEDIEAFKTLNIKGEAWDFPSRFLRKPWMTKRTEIFNAPDRDTIIKTENYIELEKSITELFKNNPDAYFFAPIGIGKNYDHIETHIAILNVALKENRLGQVFFCEDGYGMFTKNRKNHFLLKDYTWKKSNAPERTSIMWRIMGNVMSNAASKNDYMNYIPNELKSNKWQIDSVNISNDFEQKMLALSKYESQISQFGGMKKLRKLFLKYHEYWNDCEIYWSIK